MPGPIENKITIQLYGDENLQNKCLKLLARDLGVDIRIAHEKDYVTKKGDMGHYISTTITLDK